MSIIKNITENNINYKIFTVDSEQEYKFFDEYFNKFLTDNQNNKNTFIGLDFEFYKQQIRLWQICLYNKDAHNINYIFIINAQYVQPKKILLNKCKKIIYGGEGLDIPYLLSLFDNDNDKISFMDNLFDLKILCDYLRTSELIQKCGYYNILSYFNIVKKETIDKLEEINKNMGNIWEIQWNISTMSNDELTYSTYDVIYLRELLIAFYDKYKEIKDSGDFKNIIHIYRYAIMKRKNIDYKLKLKNLDKYRVIQYFKNL